MIVTYTLSRLPLNIQRKLSNLHLRRIAVFCSISFLVFTVCYTFYPTKQLEIPFYHNINFIETLPKEKLNAVILEEHHEVLPYWFGASDGGKIPKYGNTLVHIDAHSDMDIPSYTPYVPFFKYPTSKSQIVSLMQKNDVFVMGAAITGLIKQIIWVYGDWVEIGDMFNATAEQPYLIEKGELGWSTNGDQGSTRFCFCIKDEKICQFGEEEEMSYDEANCHVIHNVEVIFIPASHSHKIPALMQSKDYILDIDEDYFGVERIYDKFKKQDIKLETIEDLDELMEGIFRITNVQEEKLANDILVKMIHLISVHCELKTDMTRECSDEHTKKIYEDLSEQKSLNYALGGSTQYTFWLHKIARELGKYFTDDQRKLVAKTGFCLSDSPNSSSYRPDEPKRHLDWKVGMHTCIGHNLPDVDNQVKVFPNLESGEKAFNKILKDISEHSPGVITIARSNRDGYVPRHQQMDSERIVVKSLNKYFPNDNIAYIYDASVMIHLGQGHLPPTSLYGARRS